MDQPTPELKALPKYGELITLKEWLKYVERGLFTEYDGSGHWATEAGMDSTSSCWAGDPPADPPKWATHVMWFNR